ncbi:uncharacterized protein ASPGLDRAFT_41869 [Aspergillus glaucus CBS 516.65]|uniref:Uncharacterized protein n=1 Tax=Aspergillus glaucus CBS 516.65 TaxID=1160497 RepID=A0A1L9VWP9_ASPGL|nr:hypothetical protein ASPGLDRAFT_41869 [Aspergillus glaucus CBS 516.65]OJJ88317.1 hypothetical protein ASPGLDRAFT_41869 [Aspergillus glaucus CBS 516.65]
MPHSPNIHSMPKSNAIPSQNQHTKQNKNRHKHNTVKINSPTHQGPPRLTHGHATTQPSHLGNLRHLGRAEDVGPSHSPLPLPRDNVPVPVNQGGLCGPIDLDPSRAV